MLKLQALLVIVGLAHFVAVSQSAKSIRWWNPLSEAHQVIEGQAWAGEVQDPYHRLPTRAQPLVRKPVWDLSKNSAGLVVRFSTKASDISVRYTVSGNYSMNHMPATGVSGVDLYALDASSNWKWCRGNWDFSDTISYQFSELSTDYEGLEYRLFLPLYNQVNWLEIGVPVGDDFSFLPVRQQLPIVVYGTSIAQGACASRPGMAWTNILRRMLNRPVINLAFSGNGRLEPELVTLLAEINASIYILDCLPNLTNAELYDQQELTKRIIDAVRLLKQHRPAVPILLTEHAGYTDGLIQVHREQTYQRVNRIQKAAYHELLKQGYGELFYLNKEQLNLQLDDMVDGTHPNDLGMMHYAEAYEKVIAEILEQQ